jgi:methyl coenzyme M reductase beta subunit
MMANKLITVTRSGILIYEPKFLLFSQSIYFEFHDIFGGFERKYFICFVNKDMLVKEIYPAH